MTSKEVFAECVRSSRYAHSLVAAYWVRRGYDVISYAPHDPDTDGKFKSDSGDMKVRAEGSTGYWWKVEAKGRDSVSSMYLLHSEKCKEEGVFVDKKSTFDKKEETPDYYFIVGTDEHYALVFDVKKHWGETFEGEFFDKPEQRWLPCYNAPPHLFTRIKLKTEKT